MLPADTAYQRNPVVMFAAPALAAAATLVLSGLAYLVTPAPVAAPRPLPPLQAIDTASALPSRPPVVPVQAASAAVTPVAAPTPEASLADPAVQGERLALLASAVKGYPVIRRMVDHSMADGRLDEAEYRSIDERLARIKHNQTERNRRRARNRRR